MARDSRGWLRRLLALTTRPAVNCWCCERRRRVQRRSSSVLPARSGKSSAAVPRPSPSRAAAQKRCAPHAHSCVSDVFHAIIIMLKMESVCTFCWRAWCWSLDQDQTCCVLARLSCTGHPVKACDARTSPRPCGHEYNSTYALSFVVGVVPVLHAAFSELYHFWLAPRCVQRHKKQLGIS